VAAQRGQAAQPGVGEAFLGFTLPLVALDDEGTLVGALLGCPSGTVASVVEQASEPDSALACAFHLGPRPDHHRKRKSAF